jgi:NAD(P)-dependent dehydrogenase (short-subunit alcohol dehydrogenase family)
MKNKNTREEEQRSNFDVEGKEVGNTEILDTESGKREKLDKGMTGREIEETTYEGTDIEGKAVGDEEEIRDLREGTTEKPLEGLEDLPEDKGKVRSNRMASKDKNQSSGGTTTKERTDELKDKDMYQGKDIKGQTQDERPGQEHKMDPEPIYDHPANKGLGRLKDKVAIITGGDSGIGRAVAVAYAKEGAKVVIAYNVSDRDAEQTKGDIESYGGEALLIKGDIGDSAFCKKVVEDTVKKFGKLDILVNNAAEQHPQKSIEDITDEQLERTFRTNIFAMFYLTRAAMPHLKEGSVIINTSSVTAFRGSAGLLDYSSTKGAITSFTRSLSANLAEKKIRVNQIAPGPIWTPLIPSTFDKEKVEKFGEDVPLKRPGQPVELAEAYIFLASDGSTYITGQTIHINGGEIVNG